MRKSYVVLTAAVLLLSACGDGRNPAYVCMHDCAHYCPDGISGDQCRRDADLQRRDYENQYPADQTYYSAPAAGTVTTKTTTTTYESY